MLNIFLGRKASPKYKLVDPPNGEHHKLIVKEDVSHPNNMRHAHKLTNG